MTYPMIDELRKLTEQDKWLGRPVAELLAALRRAADALDEIDDKAVSLALDSIRLACERDELRRQRDLNHESWKVASHAAERAEAQAKRLEQRVLELEALLSK